MKKIVILLSLLITIIVPEASYSQDKEKQLLSYTDELAKIPDILDKIALDLLQISMKKGHTVAGLSGLMVESASLICFYEPLLLSYQALLFELESPDQSIWTKKRIETHSKQHLDAVLESLGRYFAESRHNATLYLIDKARENIRSAIKLLNEVLDVLEQDIKTKTKE